MWKFMYVNVKEYTGFYMFLFYMVHENMVTNVHIKLGSKTSGDTPYASLLCKLTLATLLVTVLVLLSNF